MLSSSVQNWLVSIGASETMYPSSIGRIRSKATWMPKNQWVEGDVKGTFYNRYGFYNTGTNDETASDAKLYSAGNYVGERMASTFPSESPFLGVMRKLTGDPSLILNYQDLEDLKLVKDPAANDVVYNTRIEPLINAASTSADGSSNGGDLQAQLDIARATVASQKAELVKNGLAIANALTATEDALTTMGPRGGGLPIAKARKSLKAILAALS